MDPRSVLSKLTRMSGTLLRNPSSIPFAASWLRSMLPGHNPIVDERPWINFKAIRWLESYLKPDMRVFEYGSGGSTLFFAHRVDHVTSVEHDEDFYNFVAAELKRRNIRNCTNMLVKPEPMASRPIPEYSCTSATSLWNESRDVSFRKYVETIDQYPDESFDLVTVDGRARASCALRALPKIKNGGYLMVDNMERARYQIIRDIVANSPSREFHGVVPYDLKPCKTVFWQIRGDSERQ